MVWHHVDAVALSLVSGEEAFITATISPCVKAESTDLTVNPLTGKLAII